MFINYLIKENQFKNETINTLVGSFSYQSIRKQKLQHLDIIYDQNATSECIFATNKEQILDD